MALNPFFQQGSPSEQRLVQDLINEQLKIYGIEVTYIPRRFVRKETIIKEVTSSKFDDNFLLEAYISNYDGYDYSSAPSISFTESPVPGGTAQAVAITTSVSGSDSIKEILFISPGYGYTVAPEVTISGGGGIGAAITCSIETNLYGIVSILMNINGVGYSTNPTVTVQSPNVGAAITAKLTSVLNTSSGIATIRISNPGIGYTFTPIITIAPPETIVGFGTYKFNEIVIGSKSGTKARVKSWMSANKILKVSFVGIDTNKSFILGENIVGSSSSAVYSLKKYNDFDVYDKYSENDEIETEALSILDFSERNPFGSY